MFSGSERSRRCVVFDIGSGSVSCAIVERAGNTATVVAAERITLPLEKRDDPGTVSALKQAILDVGKRVIGAHIGKRHIAETHAIVRAPWTAIAIGRAGVSLDHPVRVGDELLKQLATEALRSQRVSREHFLEAMTMRLYLNGYPIHVPEGKHAARAELIALIALCEPSVREALTSAISSVAPASHLSLHAGARCIYESLRHSGALPEECLILDVGIEGTDALIVRDGAIELDAYVGEGMRSILTRISAGAADHTLSLLRLVARDECTPDECIKLEESLARVEPELAHVFGEAFTQLSASSRLPDSIVLLAHPDLALWLQKFFARIDFTQFTTTTQPFSVRTIAPKDVAPRVFLGSGVVDDVDMRLSVSVVNNGEYAS